MSSAPVVRQISWPAVILQGVGVASAIALISCFIGTSLALNIGVALYLAYSIASRQFIPRAHQRGMRFFAKKKYQEAIRQFEESYQFFTRNAWIDRYRSITLMSPSAISYREMALCNIAFCYSQLGNGTQAEKFYRQALNEFPNSGLAASSLRMIESARSLH